MKRRIVFIFIGLFIGTAFVQIAIFTWGGAGVLPYAQDSNGHGYVLLGYEGNNEWADFGGTMEYVHGKLEKPEIGAAREGAEETIDLLKEKVLKHALLNRQNYGAQLIHNTSRQPGYFLYVVPVLYDRNISRTFKKKRQDLLKKWRNKKKPKHIAARLEKQSVQWVSVENLTYAIEQVKKSSNTWVRLVSGKKVRLRPALVGTLRRNAHQGNSLKGYQVLRSMGKLSKVLPFLYGHVKGKVKKTTPKFVHSRLVSRHAKPSHSSHMYVKKKQQKSASPRKQSLSGSERFVSIPRWLMSKIVTKSKGVFYYNEYRFLSPYTRKAVLKQVPKKTKRKIAQAIRNVTAHSALDKYYNVQKVIDHYIIEHITYAARYSHKIDMKLILDKVYQLPIPTAQERHEAMLYIKQRNNPIRKHAMTSEGILRANFGLLQWD